MANVTLTDGSVRDALRNWSPPSSTAGYQPSTTPLSPAQQMNGSVPNGVVALLAYKARPLTVFGQPSTYLPTPAVQYLSTLLSPVPNPETFYLAAVNTSGCMLGYSGAKISRGI